MKNESAVFKISRPVLSGHERYLNTIRHGCSEILDADTTYGVVLSDEHLYAEDDLNSPDGPYERIVGQPRFDVHRSLTLPLIRVVAPQDYTKTFLKTSLRLNDEKDRNSRVFAVERNLREIGLRYDNPPSLDRIEFECETAILVQSPDKSRFELAIAAGNPGQFIEEHEFFMSALRHVASLHRKTIIEQSYTPYIPIAEFAHDASIEEQQAILEVATESLPDRFYLGAVMRPLTR